MTMIMQLTTILTFVSIILLLALLWIYWQNYRKLKSGFTLGLITFALIFLIQNLMSFYYFATMMPYFVDAVEMHVFLLSMLQSIAFAVMLWNAWK